MEPGVLLDLENICTKFCNNFSSDVQHQRVGQKLVFNFVEKASFDSIKG